MGTSPAHAEVQIKIIGGTEASIAEAPWQAALIKKNAGENFDGQFCGGSIYNASWIITAAHCMPEVTTASILVQTGSNYLDPNSLSGTAVQRIIIHPNYNIETHQNDIALLQLATPLQLQPGVVWPIGLPKVRPVAGDFALITGWGDTHGPWPYFLQKAEVEVFEDSYCASQYPGFNSNAMLCASASDFSRDTCQGDSGGPIALNVDGHWDLIGITSFGTGCAQYPYPGVYTETFNYNDWIRGIATINFTTAPTPTISGTAASGQTLTLNAGTWTPAPEVQNIAWLADNSVITDETSDTLLLSPELVGKKISVRVTSTRGGYATTIKTSAQTSVVQGMTQVVSGSQRITGTTTVGQTLTADLSIWDEEATHTFIWYRGTTVISGATSSTYTLQTADFGKAIKVQVTGRLVGYNPLTLTSAATTAIAGAFVLNPNPIISGSAAVGSTLTATPGTWSPSPKFSYQWMKNDVAISGAVKSTYKLTTSDFDSIISVAATATLKGYPTTVKYSAGTEPIKAPFTTAPTPTISGTAASGQTLTLNAGTWTPAPEVQNIAWLADNSVITDETSDTLLLSPELVGKKISVRVTSTRGGYATTIKTSAQTSVVQGMTQVVSGSQRITGTTTVGQTLTADLSIWDEEATHTFIWYRGTTVISGATSSTYTLQTADFGKAIKVQVTGRLVGYNPLTLTSAATTAIAGAFVLNPNPIISGSAAVGSTLTATPGTWSPSPKFSYQWMKNDVAISGAVKSTYKLTTSDFDSIISVAATATLKGYPTTVKYSAGTEPIEPGNFTTISSPKINGNMSRGQTLEAVISGWAPTPTSLNYVWLRDGVEIQNSDSANYLLTDEDAGKEIVVEVTASAYGIYETVIRSAPKSDWKTVVVNLGTLNASYVYANCISAGMWGSSWQNYGGTFWPCDNMYGNSAGVEFYDPSTYGEMAIIHGELINIPTYATKYRLTFSGIFTFDDFYFFATDSNVNLLDDTDFKFPTYSYYGSSSTALSNWIEIIEPGQIDWVITGTSYDGGFLEITTIKIEVEYFQ